MPYELEKTPRGYYVETEETGRRHSKKPLSKKMATRQMRALYVHAPDRGSGFSDEIRLTHTGNPYRMTHKYSSINSADSVETKFYR